VARYIKQKMGKKVNPMEKVMQRSIGFHMRQHLFFAKYPNFQPDEYCRAAVDEQIRLIDGEDSEFLKKEEK